MEILNESNLSVITTSVSNPEYSNCSSSNEAKSEKLDCCYIAGDFESNKENVCDDVNDLNNGHIQSIQNDNIYNNDARRIVCDDNNLNVNTECYSDLDDDSDIEVVETSVNEQLAMLVPDLDSTLKLKHDTERFYMTLSIAEAELDLAKSASRVNNFNQEGFNNKQTETNCLGEIKAYVEELLDTINEARNTSFNIQKIVEECYDILKGSITSFNDITTLNTMDIGGIQNINYANAEKLKMLCEIITEENNCLKRQIRYQTKEEDYKVREDNNLLNYKSNINSEFYNDIHLNLSDEDKCHDNDDSNIKYYNECSNCGNNKSSSWQYILMRFFVFAFLLIIFNPAEISKDINSIKHDNISNNDTIYNNNTIFNKLEESQQEFINDIHYKLKKIHELSYNNKTVEFSICSIISEFDIFNNCFTKIRLS